MEDFVKQLHCRPEIPDSLPEQIQFQIVDVNIQDKTSFLSKDQKKKKYIPNEYPTSKRGYSNSRSNVVSIFGTTESGHSVCVIVQNFTPYFDVCIDASWDRDDLRKIVLYVQEKIYKRFYQDAANREPSDVCIKTTTYTGPRVYGYIPDKDGSPLKSKWLRMLFPSMDILRAAIKLFKPGKGGEGRRQTLSALFPSFAFNSLLLEPANYKSPVEQMFFTLTDLVPSGWVKVCNYTIVKSNYSTCQWEIKTKMQDVVPVDRSDIAPCVTLSFDIETVPEKTGNMPQAHRPNDRVVQIGVSLEVFGKGKKHGVICLGQTNPVDNVAILSCTDEVEVMNVLQRVISDSRIDPDMVTGYNIYKFDFWFMAQRLTRFEMFSETTAETYLELWEKCKEYEANEKRGAYKSRDSHIRALKNVWSTYNPPWRESANIMMPPDMELLLETAETKEELLTAFNAFHNRNLSVSFWWCSRLRNERCELRKTILESSAMGQNELFRFDMAGRCVFDLYLHCKNNMKMGSYKLDNVAKEYVGDQKIDLPYKKMFELYLHGGAAGKARVAEYCSKDCDLVLRIIEKAGIFTDNIEHSRVTYTLLSWLVTRGQQVRVYSQIGRFCERLNVALNYEFVKAPDTYEGATVIDPIKGYYRNPVATLDFAALYPSIMQAHNLCFSTLVFPKYRKQVTRMEKEGKIVVERIVASEEEHWFVQEKTYKGILPRLLHDLLSARRAVKKIVKTEKDAFKYQLLNSKQLALKISCNSVYGYTGSRSAKMGCWPIAACTTSMGRQMIDDTKAAVEREFKSTVVYGDSVSGYTPLLVKTGGRIQIIPIQNVVLGDDPIYTWTEKGWTRILNVIRHELAPHKKMLRICTHSGLVHCTNDHSLVAKSGGPISPDDVVVGTELMHSYPKEFHEYSSPTILFCITRKFVYKNFEYDSRTHAAASNGLNSLPKGVWKDVFRNVPLSENFAKLMGMFMGDGSCGTYGSGSKKIKSTRSTWALNNKDFDMLQGYKTIGEELFPEMTFKILDTLKSSGVYKMSAACSQYGAVKRFVQVWRSLFYNDRKEKKVPGEIINAPTNIRRAFWEGLHDTDGTKDSREPEISQKGQEACAGIFYLLRSLGHKCVVDSREDKPNVFRLRARSKVRKKWTAVKKITEIPHEQHVYDLTTENHHFQAGIGDMIVHNTDSVMVLFHDAEATEAGMRLSWKLAEEAAKYVTNVTFKDHDTVELEAEKVYWPYLIFDRKKRYIGRTYLDPDKSPKIDCKGVELVRRDNSEFLRDTYRRVVDGMMPLEGPALSKGEVLSVIRTEVKKSLDDLMADEIPLEKFLVTKSLKKTYKNPNLPHVVLSKKTCQRIDDGEILCDPPRPGDRISYVVIETSNTKDKLCNKSEDLDWLKTHKKLKIDREYYVSNQILKPFNQIVKPFGSLDDLWAGALSELRRQRLKIKSISTYFEPVGVENKKRPPVSSIISSMQIPPPRKKKKKQRSLFDFQ